MAMKGVTVEDAAWKGGSLQNLGGGGVVLKHKLECEM